MRSTISLNSCGKYVNKKASNERTGLICIRTEIRFLMLSAPSDGIVSNSMKQSFLKKELLLYSIPSISCSPNVHNRVRNSPQLLPILKQKKPVHDLQSYFFQSILISPSHLHLRFPINLLPTAYLRQPCTHFSALPRKPHSPSNSIPFI
jgi:hypothetical protein